MEPQCNTVQVDDSFRGILAAIAVDPLLRAFAELPGISHKVATMLPQLDACQSALLEFLEAKRSLFPRCLFSTYRYTILVFYAFCLDTGTVALESTLQ